MPTRQFDGPNLGAALEAVRLELGSDVKIVSAEKVRTGGIAGFFAKERVEVVVEVEEPAPESTSVTTPVSLLDLADSVSDGDQMEVTTAAPAAAADEPPTSFAAVLERIATEGDLALAAQTALDPPPAEEFSFAPIPELDAQPGPEPEMVTEPESDILAPFAALARRTVRDEEQDDDYVDEDEDGMEATTAYSTDLVVPEYATALERLGMPDSLVPATADGDLYGALVAQLELLPIVPELPHGRGTVLVVVGPERDALPVARDIALDLRTHPRDVVGFDANVNVGEVEDLRRSWRRRLDPTVIVVDAAVSVTDRYWVRDLIAALEPHSVWGVVDGGRKLEDLAAWYDVVGGVDALALTGVTETLTPASVLHLGLPVAMLDGEPASPELWAEILLNRIAA